MGILPFSDWKGTIGFERVCTKVELHSLDLGGSRIAEVLLQGCLIRSAKALSLLSL